jgi:hypothetical protein
MKHFFKLTCVAAILTAGIISLSSFKKEIAATNTDAYTIALVSSSSDASRGLYEWTWTLSNPNPGDGNDGTLQDVSHWSISISPEAEAALISAEYSMDGITWTTVSTSVDRDPGIKLCTGTDVLKFDIGTTGTAPTYYRVTTSQDFNINPYSTSWIKTGGGRQGCNLYYFSGIGGAKLD